MNVKNRKLLFLFLIFLAVCLLVLVVGRLAWGAESVETLTLEKVLEISREGNPLILASEARVKQARGKLVQARSEQLPQVSASLGYQKLNEQPETYAFGLDGITPIGIVPLGYEETWQAAVSLSQVLYSGGSLSARVEAERLAVSARECERERTVQSVENGVRRAFYGLQRSLSRREVAKEALELSKEHLRQVEAFYRAGVVAQNEVLRVQVAVSSAKLNLIRAESAVQVAWKQLERIVGKSLEGRFAVPSGDSDLENFVVPEDPLSRALVQRPELNGLEASRKAALMTLKAVRGQVMPQVGFAARASVADEDFFPSEQDEWSLSVFARFRLFDSGKVHGQAVEAQGAADELLNRLEDMKRQISLEVSASKVGLEGAVQRVKVASDAELQAEEDYRMALKRYQAQVGTNIDVLDARLALTDARNAKADAVAEARTAYGDLLFAMGEPPAGEKKETTR